jgi:NADP-dependent 3-hydroxy acid dehydrogenase YdfG
MEKLKDKVVLIAGATGTIGEATARLLHQSGAKVIITGRNEAKLSELATSLNLSTANVHLVDVKSSVDIALMAEKLKDANLNVDILINATGIGIIKPFEQLTEEDFMESIAINLLGSVRLIQSVLPSMKEHKKGLIINIPGVLGKTPMAGACAYAASKYALNGMMKSLREELKRTDIRITQLFLGGVDSRFWDTIDLRVQRDKMIIGEEAAKAIWFLCQQPTSGVVSEMVIQPFNHQVI